MTRKPQRVWFLMVSTDFGEMRVGNAYGSRRAAMDWVDFVRGAFRGRRVTARSMIVRFGEDGKPDAASRLRLSREFAMDVE